MFNSSEPKYGGRDSEADLDDPEADCGDSTHRIIRRAWKFCKENSDSVEVVYFNKELRESVLTRVHFQYDPKVRLHTFSPAKFMCTYKLDSILLTILCVFK